MRPSAAASCLFALLPACAVPARIVDPRTDPPAERTLQQVVKDLATADVVFLGENHDNPDGHRAHLAIIEELHERRPALALSMEMFERDVQPLLYQYLLGDVDEATFLAGSRPWPNYRTDYRPIVEWARANRVPVIAAEVPRPLAAKVAREGLPAVRGEAYAAREVTTPEGPAFDAFKKEMAGHMGSSTNDEAMRRYYAAQCLKDDTMAESIVDFLRSEREHDRATMVVHLCGHGHCDHRWGTVAGVVSRQPDWQVRVLSMREVPDLATARLEADRDVADYVVLVRATGHEEQPAPPPPKAGAGAAASTGAKPPPETAKEPAQPPAVAAGGRPGLGLMPDYGAGGSGMTVAMVTEGGSAAAAGIQEGDVIVKLAGVPVESVQGYAEALDQLKIGDTVEVVVQRGAETKKLRVKVGTRSR